MEEKAEVKNQEKIKTKDSFIDKAVSKFVDFIYSKNNKIEKALILVIIGGFILRLIAAIDLSVFADDMVYASQTAGIWSSKIISTHSNPPLFFYLTDSTFKLFGYSQFSARFWPLIAGTLIIVLVYLITSKLFDKKIALFSAIFVTLSSFLIRMTFTEMSLLVFFFCLFGTYLGMLFIEKKNYYLLMGSAILFGLGMLTKYSTPFFLLAFLVFSLCFMHFRQEKIFTKKNILSLVIFLGIIFLFSLPFLTFNFLLYKEKGITDVYFSRIIHTEKTQQFYGGLAGQERSFFDNITYWKNYENITLLYHTDLILLIFGIFGLAFLISRKKSIPLSFLLVFLIIPFILQSPGSPLPKHFAFMAVIFSIPAGYFLNELVKFSDKKNKSLKYLIIAALVIILLINIGNNYTTPKSYLTPSAESQLKSYINKNVNSNDLIVFDNRIYTSQYLWLGTPNHILSMVDFIEFYKYNSNLSTQYLTPTNVYFVECAKDDCGWGTISKQQELNKSLETLFNSISLESDADKTFTEKLYSGNEFISKSEEIEAYKIYKRSIYLNPLLVQQTDRMNSFYFVPYLYKDLSSYPFNYQINSLSDRLLATISYFIVVISVILAILSIFLAIFFLFSKKFN
ncbi:MAG: glycosyltransferase family 39 protein [Nanoarchaeota archaeon]